MRLLWPLCAALLLGGCAKGCGSPKPPARSPAPVAVRVEEDPALPGTGPGSPGLTRRLAEALRARGPDHRPNTRHLNPDGSPRYTNRLILQSSPYLLQHAHNPVNWYPWGDEAFERARREGRPVFLSVGYSTCHWCHVMEAESFEDEEIARYLNEHFVAIKVDREERPDVDSVYMEAVQLLTGGGGWPMTLVLTPDKEPFFGATYLPARDGDRGARRGLLGVLRELAETYARDPGRVVEQAGQLTNRIRASAAPAAPSGVPGPEAIHLAALVLAQSFDPVNGGFGGAPKFPRPAALELLARYHRRTRDPGALRMITRTLEGMAAGGLFDHVGGGFHRYSVDAAWRVPHFEKMLYDNAQLAAVYLEGYQLTGREDFARVARRTLDYVAREMTAPEGGFYSATDADSPGPDGVEREGWYFTWTPAEVEQAVGAERARAVEAYYGVTPTGSFGGRSVLRVDAPLEDVARGLGRSPAALERELDAARAALLAARSRRPPPRRDTKVVASWNGLMISAFARGARVLGEPRYAQAALRAADFVEAKLKSGDRLRRWWTAGEAGGTGTLDDYAFVAQGFLDLYEATSDPKWLGEALALHRALAAHFLDPRVGGFFLTPDDGEPLLVREKPAYDGAEPSGNSVAVLNLLRLAELTGDARPRGLALRTVAAVLSISGAAAAPELLCGLDFLLDTPLEVAIVAPRGQRAPALEAVLRRSFVPNGVQVVAAEGPDLERQAARVPLLAEKRALGGRPTAYVCRQQVCALPTADPKVFEAQLEQAEPLLPGATPAPLPVRGGPPGR